MAWSGSEFEESMLSTRTQTTSHNLLLQTYICAAELATWGVGPDVLLVTITYFLSLVLFHLVHIRLLFIDFASFLQLYCVDVWVLSTIAVSINPSSFTNMQTIITVYNYVLTNSDAQCGRSLTSCVEC